MFAQVAQKVLPFVPRRFIEQPAMCAIDTKPDFLTTEQRKHARKRKSEVSQRFTVTRMYYVDGMRRFGDDCGAQFAWRRGRDVEESGPASFSITPACPDKSLQSMTSDHRQP